jgi:hypothetical protein
MTDFELSVLNDIKAWVAKTPSAPLGWEDHAQSYWDDYNYVSPKAWVSGNPMEFWLWTDPSEPLTDLDYSSPQP